MVRPAEFPRKGPMVEPRDVWYIRLPDGRVLRAGSTAAVRRHVQSGRIPPNSRVRRSPADPWTYLRRTTAFGDLIPQRNRRPAAPRQTPSVPAPPPAPPRPAARPRRPPPPLAGVRGGVAELLTALD